jgi:hypothetical protein
MQATISEISTTRKKYELDLLLMAQGPSKYNWDEIGKGKIETKYGPVDGLNLYGFLNEDLKRESILVHKSIEHEATEINLSPDQRNFLVTNFYPINGESIYFSKKNRWGKIIQIEYVCPFVEQLFLG